LQFIDSNSTFNYFLFSCFERGKNVHAETCKKNKKKKVYISNAINLDPTAIFVPNTLYSDSFVKFDLGSGQELSDVCFISSIFQFYLFSFIKIFRVKVQVDHRLQNQEKMKKPKIEC
jgi:hypothetical protein